MTRVSILFGRQNDELVYAKVFANRQLAERQKEIFEDYDRKNDNHNWVYFIDDTIVEEKVG